MEKKICLALFLALLNGSASAAWRCIPAQVLRDRPSNENTP